MVVLQEGKRHGTPQTGTPGSQGSWESSACHLTSRGLFKHLCPQAVWDATWFPGPGMQQVLCSSNIYDTCRIVSQIEASTWVHLFLLPIGARWCNSSTRLFPHPPKPCIRSCWFWNCGIDPPGAGAGDGAPGPAGGLPGCGKSPMPQKPSWEGRPAVPGCEVCSCWRINCCCCCSDSRGWLLCVFCGICSGISGPRGFVGPPGPGWGRLPGPPVSRSRIMAALASSWSIHGWRKASMPGPGSGPLSGGRGNWSPPIWGGLPPSNCAQKAPMTWPEGGGKPPAKMAICCPIWLPSPKFPQGCCMLGAICRGGSGRCPSGHMGIMPRLGMVILPGAPRLSGSVRPWADCSWLKFPSNGPCVAGSCTCPRFVGKFACGIPGTGPMPLIVPTPLPWGTFCCMPGMLPGIFPGLVMKGWPKNPGPGPCMRLPCGIAPPASCLSTSSGDLLKMGWISRTRSSHLALKYTLSTSVRCQTDVCSPQCHATSFFIRSRQMIHIRSRNGIVDITYIMTHIAERNTWARKQTPIPSHHTCWLINECSYHGVSLLDQRSMTTTNEQ